MDLVSIVGIEIEKVGFGCPGLSVENFIGDRQEHGTRRVSAQSIMVFGYLR